MASNTHDCSECTRCQYYGYCNKCSVHNIHDCSNNCYDCIRNEYCDECSVHNTHDCSTCTKCQKNEYCEGCFLYHKRIYVEWSSGNKDIDSLINECNNINYYKCFQWIPFERFTNVEYLAKGGFASIYKGTCLVGRSIINWVLDHEENKFKRLGG